MISTAKRLLADIQDMAPDIAARAAEVEASRRLPLDLVQTLKSIGALRLFVPLIHRGFELDLPEALEVIAALGRIDGSVGWTVMIGNGGDLFAPLLPRETYEQVYRDGADVVIAGSVQPSGTAMAVHDGWRVSGRWPFASGCQHADWMFGLCVMTEGGIPVRGGSGLPLVRGFFLPARDWQIEDTWYVAGLKGTGSHHISLKGTVVPAANFFDFPRGVPCFCGPLYQSLLYFLPLLHGAITVGMAEGALDELIALAKTGRQQARSAAPMRESEIFQGELGRVAADLRAARALLQTQAASHWRHALAGTLNDEVLLTQGTQTAIWLARTCVGVASACFALAGGSALYETSPLQRRLRDLHAAAQHAAVQQRHYVDAGKLLLHSSIDDARTGDEHPRRKVAPARHRPQPALSIAASAASGEVLAPQARSIRDEDVVAGPRRSARLN
jgi:alkylation response protein AidB-like acyl-CoA dehydrogenase